MSSRMCWCAIPRCSPGLRRASATTTTGIRGRHTGLVSACDGLIEPKESVDAQIKVWRDRDPVLQRDLVERATKFLGFCHQLSDEVVGFAEGDFEFANAPVGKFTMPSPTPCNALGRDVADATADFAIIQAPKPSPEHPRRQMVQRLWTSWRLKSELRDSILIFSASVRSMAFILW